jgi:O-glycosyl hydrolase
MQIHQEISKYPNISLIASVWSPPHYMKNPLLHTLLIEEEPNYHFYLKNITTLMKQQFNLDVEAVSPVNEPENIFAPWEHTNMSPQQLCRMVRDFNDSLVSICPENSYFWISEGMYEIV